MSKASTAKVLEVSEDTHTIIIEVTHSDSASYSRSVRPAANKAFDKFMRSVEGSRWVSEGFYRFSSRCDFGAVEGGTIVTFSVTV